MRGLVRALQAHRSEEFAATRRAMNRQGFSKMTRSSFTRLMLAILALASSSNAMAQVGRLYKEGPVTAVTYLEVEYGRFDEYVAWLTSTWKPTMEAKKKAGETVSGNIDSFTTFVQKKTSQIRKQYKCEKVEYSVEVQDGHVKLKAKAKV